VPPAVAPASGRLDPEPVPAREPSLRLGPELLPRSTGDYRLLSDRRSYPRNLAMILTHLLEPA